jgi:HSP20 family protein
MATLQQRNGSAFDTVVDRLFEEATRALGDRERIWTPSFNAYDDEQGMTVQLALPGVDPAAIDVQIKDEILTVSGERSWDSPEGRRWHARNLPHGQFKATFALPPTVDHDKASAVYKDGMLTISFPKREEAKPRRITVQLS